MYGHETVTYTHLDEYKRKVQGYYKVQSVMCTHAVEQWLLVIIGYVQFMCLLIIIKIKGSCGV